MQKGDEIACARVLDRIETEDAREGRIAGDNRTVGVHDEVAGQVFLDKAPVAFLAPAQGLLARDPARHIDAELQKGGGGIIPLQSPASRDDDLRPVPANLLDLALPMVRSLQSLPDGGQFLRRTRLQERMHVASDRLIARPAVEALRAAIPIGYFARRIRNDDRVVRRSSSSAWRKSSDAHFPDRAAYALPDRALDGRISFGRCSFRTKSVAPARSASLTSSGSCGPEKKEGPGALFRGPARARPDRCRTGGGYRPHDVDRRCASSCAAPAGCGRGQLALDRAILSSAPTRAASRHGSR